MPEIVDAWRMSGDVDYLLHVVVPDIAAYDDFYRRLIGAVPLAQRNQPLFHGAAEGCSPAHMKGIAPPDNHFLGPIMRFLSA